MWVGFGLNVSVTNAYAMVRVGQILINSLIIFGVLIN